MFTSWHTLTRSLLVALAIGSSSAACGGSHEPQGGTDAGQPAEDGGSCIRLPIQLTPMCPASTLAAGTTSVRIPVTVASEGCCAESSALSARSTGTGAWRVESTSSYCCDCPLCDCVGGSYEREVTIEGLVVGTNRVQVGETTCVFDVPALMCRPATAGDVRASTALLVGQSPAITVDFDLTGPIGCGCRPELAVTDPAGTRPGGGGAGAPVPLMPRIDARICNCCELCECIDPGYEASMVLTPPPHGFYNYQVGDQPWSFSVWNRAECSTVVSEGHITVVPPSESLRVGEPRLTWVRYTTTASYCCAAPQIAFEINRSGSNILLTPVSCGTGVDCACAPSAHDVTSWVSLGDLGEGHYTVELDGIVEAFDVH